MSEALAQEAPLALPYRITSGKLQPATCNVEEVASGRLLIAMPLEEANGLLHSLDASPASTNAMVLTPTGEFIKLDGLELWAFADALQRHLFGDSK